jgi:hypothetical protein
MGNNNFVLRYVQDCIGGELTLSDCGPVWQFGVIAALLAAAILFLLLLVMRPQGRSAQR